MSWPYVPFLRGILERRAGLDLGRGGMETTLATFVQRRVALTGLSFDQYVEQLEVPGSEELLLLVEAMTVVYTWFFRDPAQFSAIEYLIRAFPGDGPILVWVAGCATGEEAYSVALVAASVGKRVSILGTDVNSAALEHARTGRYSAASLNAVDTSMRQKYLAGVSGDFVIPDTIRQCVRFQMANLVDMPPRCPTGDGWNLIICRNVLIYFTKEQASRTLDTFASGLAPGGHLVLGASEAILDRPAGLDVVVVAGRAVLQRPQPGLQTNVSNADRVTPLTALCRVTPDPPRAVTRSPASPWTAGPAADKPSGVVRSLVHHGGAPPPDSTACLLQQGYAALDAGDIATAKDLCMQAVQGDPTCAEAAMLAGIAHYLDGDSQEALQLLRGALCLDPTLWVACFYQALCYDNIGYADDAARSYAQVTRIAERQACNTGSRPLLDNWRDDLLAVAKKRSACAAHKRDRPNQGRVLAR